jgi:hypothetical protein
MVHASGSTVDAFLGWLSVRIGRALPRLADLTGWPSLAVLADARLDRLLPDDPPLPLTVTATGSWEILPGIVVTRITVDVAAPAAL